MALDLSAPNSRMAELSIDQINRYGDKQSAQQQWLAEENLAEERNKWKTAQENIKYGYERKDAEKNQNRADDANRRAEEQQGWNRDEAGRSGVRFDREGQAFELDQQGRRLNNEGQGYRNTGDKIRMEGDEWAQKRGMETMPDGRARRDSLADSEEQYNQDFRSTQLSGMKSQNQLTDASLADVGTNRAIARSNLRRYERQEARELAEDQLAMIAAMPDGPAKTEAYARAQADSKLTPQEFQAVAFQKQGQHKRAVKDVAAADLIATPAGEAAKKQLGELGPKIQRLAKLSSDTNEFVNATGGSQVADAAKDRLTEQLLAMGRVREAEQLQNFLNYDTDNGLVMRNGVAQTALTSVKNDIRREIDELKAFNLKEQNPLVTQTIANYENQLLQIEVGSGSRLNRWNVISGQRGNSDANKKFIGGDQPKPGASQAQPAGYQPFGAGAPNAAPPPASPFPQGGAGMLRTQMGK